MREFEALTNIGAYRSGQCYTFIKVPQVVKNAVMMGYMREVKPQEQKVTVGEAVMPSPPKKRGRPRKAVETVADVSSITLEALDELRGKAGL